jgi:carboxyl-terminal processing protease
MRGEPGEEVRLVVRHADSDRPETKHLVREVIHVDSILGDRRTADGHWEFRLEQDPRIAQVRVTTFGNKTTDELVRVLGRLREEGVEAAVLDLRDDAGGALDTAIAICDLFLPEGKLIVDTRGRDDAVYERYLTSGSGQFLDVPLVVLVNNQSASASEIVAACLQDHGRAAVAGERTYGKGTVQKLIPVESGRSLLKLTAASYRRPNGKNIHRTASAAETDDWGVSPDEGLAVKLDDAEYEAYLKYRADRDLWSDPPKADEAPSEPFVDRQLEKAIEHLRRTLGTGAA